MLSQQITEQDRLENQIYIQMRDIFNKVISAGIVTPEYYDNPITGYDPEWKYSEYTVTAEGVHIRGYKYAGCGNTDDAYFTIPLDQIDNIAIYISEQQEKLKIAQQEKLIAEQAEAEQDAREQDERELAQYNELKKKFEGEKL